MNVLVGFGFNISPIFSKWLSMMYTTQENVIPTEIIIENVNLLKKHKLFNEFLEYFLFVRNITDDQFECVVKYLNDWLLMHFGDEIGYKQMILGKCCEICHSGQIKMCNCGYLHYFCKVHWNKRNETSIFCRYPCINQKWDESNDNQQKSKEQSLNIPDGKMEMN